MQMLKDVMSRDVQLISPDHTISDAAQKMRDGNFGLMPVGDSDRLLGVISDRDIAIRAVAQGKPLTTKIRDIMFDNVISASQDDSVDHAASLMGQHQIRRLPVLDGEKRLVGIVSLGDFAVDRSDIVAAGAALSKISKAS